jgi:hypothetical protein
MPDGKSFEQIEKEKKAAAAAAAEAEKKAEPLVLEEDDEFEEFEQEGALALAPSFLPRELAPRRGPVWYLSTLAHSHFRCSRTRADWTAAEEDADDTKQWQDDWDDDDVTGDFSQSLRAEIEKCKAAAAAAK